MRNSPQAETANQLVQLTEEIEYAQAAVRAQALLNDLLDIRGAA